jgi:hypothetical protein
VRLRTQAVSSSVTFVQKCCNRGDGRCYGAFVTMQRAGHHDLLHTRVGPGFPWYPSSTYLGGTP